MSGRVWLLEAGLAMPDLKLPALSGVHVSVTGSTGFVFRVPA